MQGHYVPQLAMMIVDGNAKPGAQQLNLQGFLLGVHCCSLARVCLTSQGGKQSSSDLGKMTSGAGNVEGSGVRLDGGRTTRECPVCIQ